MDNHYFQKGKNKNKLLTLMYFPTSETIYASLYSKDYSKYETVN